MQQVRASLGNLRKSENWSSSSRRGRWRESEMSWKSNVKLLKCVRLIPAPEPPSLTSLMTPPSPPSRPAWPWIWVFPSRVLTHKLNMYNFTSHEHNALFTKKKKNQRICISCLLAHGPDISSPYKAVMAVSFSKICLFTHPANQKHHNHLTVMSSCVCVHLMNQSAVLSKFCLDIRYMRTVLTLNTLTRCTMMDIKQTDGEQVSVTVRGLSASTKQI